MPIAGKTDTATENSIGGLQVVYRLWKGNKKGDRSAGSDLKNRFRFEANDRTREKFEQFYRTSQPESVRIFLPYAHVDDVFQTWMESYTAQGLKHRCNGERIIEEMVKVPYPAKVKGKIETHYTWQKKACDRPCMKGDSPVCQDPECDQQGRLFFYVRELYSQGLGSTKCGMLTVTGDHDITGFHEQLRGLQAKYGSLHASPIPSPQTFGFIPYVLTREEKSIFRPAAPGAEHKVRGTTWVLSISEDPEWLQALQRWQQAREMMKLAENPEILQLVFPGAKVAAQLPASVAAGTATDNWRSQIYEEINNHLKRLDWNKAKAVEHLTRVYGKKTRDELGDRELTEFRDFLRNGFVPPPRQEVAEAIEAEVLEPEGVISNADLLKSEAAKLGIAWKAATQMIKDSGQFPGVLLKDMTPEQVEAAISLLKDSVAPEPQESPTPAIDF